jgi:Ca-activated chloride channel family protein
MLATDLQPNRFEHAKQLINQVFDGLQGDRVGLVAFAGNAVLRFPLTTDIEAARELVRSTAIREGNLRPGTGIGDALKVAGMAFGEDSARSKLIVLISDGEDLAGEALESVRTPRDRGVAVYAVGIGTDTGSTLSVPDPRTGRTQPRIDPQTGQPAVSRANESLMRSIATAGRGKFYNGNAPDAAAPLNQEIAALERTRFASQEGSLPIERYQWFLAAGLALLVIEMLIPERRRRTGGATKAEKQAGRTEGRRAA